MTGVVATVIMPARNASGTIAEQLDALAHQNTDLFWELVVVDNGSTDDTMRLAGTYADTIPKLSVISCTRPGANAARNAGARVARGESLLFCDSDDRVSPDWVSAMVKSLEAHDVVGGTIDNDFFGAGHMQRHPMGVPVVAGFLPRAISANLGVHRSAWSAVDGFSEDYEYGCTDTEFCWRLQLAGHTIGYAEDAVVAYRHRDTLKSAAIKAYRTGRSRGRLFRDFRGHGMARPRLAGVAFRWTKIIAATPLALFSPEVRWWWVNEASGAVGRIVGSITFRVRYL